MRKKLFENTIKINANVYVEKLLDGFYLIVPGILVNRINPDNLDNFLEPQRTRIKEAINLLNKKG